MKKSNIYLLLTIVILSVVSFFVLQEPGEKSVSLENREYFLQFDTTQIAKIELRTKEGELLVEKANSVWTITSPINYTASHLVVANALFYSSKLKVLNLASTNPEKQDLFQLDSASTRVKLYDSNKMIADFYVGKASGGFKNSYVRNANSNEVYLIDAPVSYVFNTSMSNWRDRTIVSAKDGEINEVIYKRGDNEEYTLAKQDTSWFVDGKRVDHLKALETINKLSKLQTDEFVDSLKDYVPTITGSISFLDMQVIFSDQEDGRNYLVKTSKSPQWFEINKSKAEKIFRKKEEFFTETSDIKE